MFANLGTFCYNTPYFTLIANPTEQEKYKPTKRQMATNAGLQT